MSISFVYPHLLWLFSLVPLTAALALLGPRRPTLFRFWGSLALRIALLSSIILALSGVQLRLRADTLTVVFLLDTSDSIPQEQQSYGESLIRSAVAEMPAGDKAAVVVFGQDALVERLASEENSLPGLASVPVTFRTDIASALQLGLALFPDEGAKRLVLLSDGRENMGQALEQAELAAAHGIELSYIPLQGPQGEVEVLLEALNTPSDVRAGQSFDLTAIVQSTAQSSGTLRVFGDGQLIYTQGVRLQPGANRFLIPVEAGEGGFRRFQAQILPDADTRLQNNAASAFTVVHGPPHVLLVEGQPADGNNLAEALEAAGMQVSRVPPNGMPGTLAELAAYDAVVLANVPAGSLPDGAMESLPVYVRDLGRGLLMAGGENSFGAGGYLRSSLEEALPVYMDVRARELSANLALVLAVDKSGSMGRCHCDNPDLNQSYTRQEVGQPKVDIAKEAIMRAASALSEQDILGVVAFDDQARWAVEASRLTDLISLEQSIGGIQAFGQTNVGAGVEAAYAALQNSDARRKHIILLTDGWTHSGDLTALAEEMSAEGITLSVVAAGEGSAEYLENLADAGGGRYYAAEDIFGVPDFFLKETIQAVGEYIIEQPFYPLPSLPGQVLSGLDPAGLPALYGYNGTSPKNTAQTQLATPQGHPLLVTWQYGLGRSAAWTSDLKGQWASDWVEWEGFPRFAAQLVGWTLPAPQDQGLVAQAGLEQDQAVIRLEAADEDGRPRNFLDALATVIDPDLGAQEVRLSQVGAGRYETSLEVSEPGTYLVRLGVNEGGQSLGQQTLGLVVPYSPEYKESGTQLGFLDELARVTGGGPLAEPVAAFTHNLPIADYAREIWRPLLFAVALLFPLDVALRRVMLNPGDLRKAVAWLRERLPAARQAAPSEGRALGPLFQARERAQQRTRQRRSEAAPRFPKAPVAEKPKDTETAEPPPPTPAQDATEKEDTLARLRDAKRRARKGN
jgi:Mg-chelatase subunit ChlD